ncbi:MAG: tRNA (adenosine(37)-N6)-threonylcarbamoyltransferase complex dimerization subunit type 1 TsaB [Oscillospiraceae bacterium]|nr:tRNA (adenosine(37)-N6)-threonylcarbamoyltransferase complex dimerization subunit type 1 TsaB [Oscillospiraceae bacterium]
MLILSVDTSGKTASCAIAEDGLLLGYRMLYTARAHSQILLPMAKELLSETGHTAQDVDLFAAADGPGSYTGLRIGIAAMQALAFAGGKHCAGISTLEGLAWNLCGREGVLCACLAARKDLCYCAFFESSGETVRRLTEDRILPAAEISAQIAAYAQPVMVIGDGADLLKKEALCSFHAAPMHLRSQSACGIAMAAMHAEPQQPEELTVRYLQEVKIG